MNTVIETPARQQSACGKFILIESGIYRNPGSGKQDRLTRAIERETRFGIGAHFKDRRADAVLAADWSVMAAQNDLVTVLGQFDPKLVKMAPSGERPED